MVEVVYVCGPDYWRHLYLSLRTLYASNSQFDSVRIFVTSSNKPSWNFGDDRIKIETVNDIGKGYWYLNKTYLCNSEAETVIFLDTDTMVLRPIEEIYRSREEDIIARYAPGVYTQYWSSEEWKKKYKHFGCSEYPYLSCGFTVFQNGSHRKIRGSWIEIAERILKGEVDEQTTRFAEQEAMSIASCIEGLSLGLMEPHHHAYAMNGEDHEGAYVYHLGTPNFYHYYLHVEKKVGLKNKQLPIRRPRFLWLCHFANRAKKRLEKMKEGHRDTDVNWGKID